MERIRTKLKNIIAIRVNMTTYGLGLGSSVDELLSMGIRFCTMAVHQKI